MSGDLEKLAAALASAGAAGLTQTEISYGVFGRNRSTSDIQALLYELTGRRLVEMVKEPSNGRGGPHPLRWRVISYARVPEERPVPDASADDRPPPGEGWLPKKEVTRQAERGVMPAHATRVGRRVRRNKRKHEKAQKPGAERLTEESLGRSYLITQTFYSYRRQGVIEQQGHWVRLARNPTTRPRHAWSSYLLELLAAAHPTLDGKWRRKPKRTLVGVTEAALGRPLEPHERVRRFPGYAGSWDPRHILLFDSEQETVTTLAEIQSRTS